MGVADCWRQMGVAAVGIGDVDRAMELFLKALEHYTRLGATGGAAECRDRLSRIRLERRDFAAARTGFTRALAQYDALGSPRQFACRMRMVQATIRDGAEPSAVWEAVEPARTALSMVDHDGRVSSSLGFQLVRAALDEDWRGFDHTFAEGAQNMPQAGMGPGVVAWLGTIAGEVALRAGEKDRGERTLGVAVMIWQMAGNNGLATEAQKIVHHGGVMPIDRRIAIVGAGPAGLSAAMYLKRKGYRDVVVFEKDPTVGGKCHSFSYAGNEYDMGANLTTPRYEIVRGLGQELGLTLREIAPRRVINLSDEEFKSLTDANYLVQMLLRGGASYYTAARGLTKIATPGFKDLGERVQGPFGDWLNAHGLERLREVFANVFIAYGYGVMDELPAAYAMKFFDHIHLFLAVDLILGKEIHATKDFAEGFQELWERAVVAYDLDVRREALVTRVERGPRGVKIEWTCEGEELDGHFDKLILAMPLDRTSSFLDASSEEERLFAKIEYYQYYVTAAVLKDVPQTTTYVLPYTQRLEPGQPTAFYLPIPNDPNNIFPLLRLWG